MSASAQANAAWAKILTSPQPPATLEWPSFSDLKTKVGDADYNHILQCPLDFSSSSTGADKTLCPHGCVARCSIEWIPPPPDSADSFTGVFAANTGDCIVRLSSAIRPPAHSITGFAARAALYLIGRKLREAELFPCVALKAFRADSRSGNLLFGAAKTGQTVKNFFAHCVATNMTERMAMPLRPVINKFREFSDFPLSLGVSDFAAITGEGEEIQKEEVKFPWVLCLSPAAELSGDVAGGGFEGFIEQIVSVKAGSHLYDIYACPQPQDAAAAGTLVKLGRIVTTTDFVPSSSDGLFFKHQRKEEDYEVRPEWIEQLQTHIIVGGSSGTAAQLAGWGLFEEKIKQNQWREAGKKVTKERRGQRDK